MTKLVVEGNLLQGSTADIQLMANSLPVLKMLDISTNSFVGDFAFDSTQTTSLQVLNVSHNGFNGTFSANFPDPSRLFVLDGSANSFGCPLPLLPTRVLFPHSSCVHPWGSYLLIVFVVCSVVAVIGWYLVSRTSLGLTWATALLWGWWLVIGFMSINDYVLLFNMLLRTLNSRIECSLLDQRAYFLPFMPFSDVGRGFQLPPFYNSMDSPLPTQTFSDFISEFQPSVYSVASSGYLTTAGIENQHNTRAFISFCSNFRNCIASSSPFSCVSMYSSVWSDPTYAPFLSWLVTILVLRCLLDLAKFFYILVLMVCFLCFEYYSK